MKIALTTFACMALLAGRAAPPPEPVVATVGSERITLREYEKILASAVGPATGELLRTTAGKEQLLDDIIRGKLVLVAAKQAGVPDRPEVRQHIAKLRLELDEYFELQTQEIIGKEFIREQMVLADKEADAYYQKHKTELQSPVELKTRQMLLASQAQAGEMLKRLRQGAHFASLAKEFSADKVTGARGGELDYFGRGQCPFGVEVEEAAFALASLGEFSPPVPATGGWRIIELIAKRPGKVATYDETMFRIRSMLKTQKYDEIVASLAKNIHVEVNRNALAEAAVRQPPAVGNETTRPVTPGKME